MRATQSNPELSRDQSWDEVKARQENKKFLKRDIVGISIIWIKTGSKEGNCFSPWILGLLLGDNLDILSPWDLQLCLKTLSNSVAVTSQTGSLSFIWPTDRITPENYVIIRHMASRISLGSQQTRRVFPGYLVFNMFLFLHTLLLWFQLKRKKIWWHQRLTTISTYVNLYVKS